VNAQWHARHPMPRTATPEHKLAWHLGHQRHCGCRPIPARLASLTGSGPSPGSLRGRNALRRLLSGGDRRSIARSKHVLALVRATPERVSELASLAGDSDWLVSMRAIDLLEKVAHEHADRVQPYKKLFIGRLADSDQWEIRLQIVRALPLLRWTPRERTRVSRGVGHLHHLTRRRAAPERDGSIADRGHALVDPGIWSPGLVAAATRHRASQRPKGQADQRRLLSSEMNRRRGNRSQIVLSAPVETSTPNAAL